MCYTQEYCDRLPKFTKGLSVLSWAYNEEENIREYLDKITELLARTVEDYEIIIVNDGSVDRTKEIILDCISTNPRIKLLDKEKNAGAARACNDAIQQATKEFMMWQTVDWSYDISKLRGFLDHMYKNGADVVAGVRRAPVEAVNRLHKIIAGLILLLGIKHITKRSDTLWKAFVSVCNYIMIRTLFNIPLSDYQNIYIYKTRLIQQVIPETNSSFLSVEYLFKCFCQGAKACEVPVTFIPRRKGVAKGAKFSAIRSSVKDILSSFWRWRIVKRLSVKNIEVVRLDPSLWD